MAMSMRAIVRSAVFRVPSTSRFGDNCSVFSCRCDGLTQDPGEVGTVDLVDHQDVLALARLGVGYQQVPSLNGPVLGCIANQCMAKTS
jgi:hypothetical protein